MEILGREVRTVFPTERMPLKLKSGEGLDIAQGLKNLASEVAPKIDFAIKAIVKPEMHSMISDMFGADDVQKHQVQRSFEGGGCNLNG